MKMTNKKLLIMVAVIIALTGCSLTNKNKILNNNSSAVGDKPVASAMSIPSAITDIQKHK